jgi:hypothetical protein
MRKVRITTDVFNCWVTVGAWMYSNEDEVGAGIKDSGVGLHLFNPSPRSLGRR